MKEELIKTSLDSIVLSDAASVLMFENVMRKYREKKKKTKYVRLIVPVTACAALAAVGVGITSAVLMQKVPDKSSETSFEYADGNKDISGGGSLSPLSPSKNILLYCADAVLTDEEGYVYLRENEASIKNSLTASGVPVNDMRISEHGYRHINCDDTLEYYFINLGFREYIIHDGEKPVSTVTVTKDPDGFISCSVSFGADEYYRALDDLIKHNKGGKMIFLYVGSLEIILTENSDPLCLTCDVSELFRNIPDPFGRFCIEEAVFTP